MKIKLWGVRGSIPTPLTGSYIQKKIKRALSLAKPGDISSNESIDDFINTLPRSIKSTYGGNTTCIEVTTEDKEMIIIDAGSGIKNLGSELMKGEFGKGKGQANIFLTHTHWDHIQGIPFFVPMFIKGNRFNFYSSMDDLNKRLDHQQVSTHFPVSLDYMQASKHFFKINYDEEFFINDTKFFVKKMPHPGNAYGIRIEEKNRTFVYTSDCEFNIDIFDEIDTYKDLFINADVVIFDSQYTFEESIAKFDYGHSSASIAIDIAAKFNVKRLILFHHDPEYSDEKLESVISNARTYLKMKPRIDNLIIEIAYEGMIIDL